nr:hypothetical protein [uncultured Roseovarius sp.]
MTKHSLFSVVFSLIYIIGLAPSAMADHKSNVPDYDFATRGANYPGWLSEGDCAADRPGQGCRMIVSSCGKHANSIYTTQRIADALQAAANEGQEIPVHSMSATGHFINVQCIIGR